MRRSLIALIVLVSTVAGRGWCQRARVYLTPFGGGFVPLRELGSIQVLDIEGNPVTVDSKMQAAAGGGGRLAYWPRRRFGIEASVFYSKARVRVTDGQSAALFDAELELGSVKGLWQVSNGLTGTDFVVSAGVAGARHGGQGFRIVGPSTQFGGVVGTGLYIVMSSDLTLRLDGEAFAYRYSAGPGFGSRTQLDVTFTAGFNILLSR